LKNYYSKLFNFIFAGIILCCTSISLCAQSPIDTTPPKLFKTISNDSLKFPLTDRRGDRFSWKNRNSFDVKDTGYLSQTIDYDAKTRQYIIKEKIGKSTYRKPTTLSFKEFYDLKSKQQEAAYFKQRSDALMALNKKVPRPKHQVYDKLFDRTFGIGNIAPNAANAVKDVKSTIKGVKDSLAIKPKGLLGSFIDIKPTGNVDILMGYQGIYTNNPTLPERSRNTGGFDFDMNANVGINANIGDKLKLPINYNTLANFDFANQIKLDYKGSDDEILRNIEAGNTSFQSKGTLIPSATNLFGIKAQLQFGRVSVTAVVASQRSQRQSQTLQGGSAVLPFNKKLSEYDENRHYLLAQHFKKNYNTAMSKLPIVTSQIQVSRIEVWVTHRNGVTTDARDVVGFMDMGESSVYNSVNTPNNSRSNPDNANNNLYAKLTQNITNRASSNINTNMAALQLKPVDDYEKTFARKLTTNEYTFNPKVGYISLNSQLLPDDVLAVAYEYSMNGKVFKVGEFSQEIALDTTSAARGNQKMLYLKLLKATSARTNLPIWGLMMKNVYTLDQVGIQKEGFQLNVLYDQPSGGLNRYLPQSSAATSGKPIISLINLDRLNSQNDPQPDGQFDFVSDYTIFPQYGRIVFPLLEPFGRDLDTLAFANSPDSIRKKYVFKQLYDSIKAIAQTYANLDRFVMQGQAKGTGGSEIYLGAFNIPQGSVRINAGGRLLTEGSDFTIDYNLGSVKIINQGILNSGVPVNVSYENNANFGIQQRNFLGVRIDYVANKKFALGATMAQMSERPFFTKVGIGEDPVSNTIYGVDFSYKNEWPGLTKFLNKLPFYNTKAKSNIAVYGEAAYFKPGHPAQIGSGENGLIYIDDFEGTRSGFDLKYPISAWALASTPSQFPESKLNDSIDYNFNRAKLAWYNIEPNFLDKNSTTNPLKNNLKELSDARVRQVYTNELFPQQSTNITNTLTQTFDLSFYPKEVGPYNFVSASSKIDAAGKLLNPTTKWGGIMRSIDQTDFETNNFEFLEFWAQDPITHIRPNKNGGNLVIELGSVSEDILKDGKRLYENGLSTLKLPAQIDSTTTWGAVPVNPIQVTNAFSNDPSDRPFQDVGFDGLNDDAERRKRFNYLNNLATNFGISSEVYKAAITDPSHDNYLWVRDAKFTANDGILARYKNFNNPQGNSPVAGSNSDFSPATTLYPDNEDLNHDNTLNETEQYYQYNLQFAEGMNVGNVQYITDRKELNIKGADGIVRKENWVLFRVPLKSGTKVGNITDFKSIRFMRMYLTGWDDSVTIRFARMDLIRNQWRQFQYVLDTTGNLPPIGNPTSTINTLAVNLEENSARTPVNYLIPPGIERVQTLSNNGINLLLNEQSLALRFNNLANGESRAIFKTLNMDLRMFGKLNMFAHLDKASSGFGGQLNDSDLSIVVRIGQDFSNNYYEIKYPLKVTQNGSYPNTPAGALQVWPEINNLDFALQQLIDLKLRRNNSGIISKIYREKINGKTFSIFGNPNLGEVRGMLVAIENTNRATFANGELWINELRLSKIDEIGAYAATGRAEITLADLGKITLDGSITTQGFGGIESKIQERSRENLSQYSIALNIDGGKLLPKAAKLSVPIYASISNSTKTPQFDPYDKDILYNTKIDAAKTASKRDSIRQLSVDETTIKTINFTNVKVAPGKKTGLLSLSNFDFSFTYTQTINTSPTIAQNKIDKYAGSINYNYQKSSKYIEPFKKLIKSKSPWLALIKDFNFNLKPSTLGFRAIVKRDHGMFVPRIVNTILTPNQITRVDTTYDKAFTFDRNYTLRWDVSKSLNLDFNATNNARVDEPYGAIDTKEKSDSIRGNFFKGGRNTFYTQKSIASYTLPLSKFPLTDFITARYGYSTNFNWIGASRIAVGLGNTIENGQDNTFTTQLDMSRLYNKFRLFRNLDNANSQNGNQNFVPRVVPKKADVLMGLEGKARDAAFIKWKKDKKSILTANRLQRQSMPINLGAIPKFGLKLLTMLKTVQVDYTESYKSSIPGFMDSSQAFGNNFTSMQPGLDYVFGKQPDAVWLERKATAGLFSRDSTFNTFFRQNFEQKLNINAQIEPFREFTIDLSLTKTFSKEYTELFKDSSTAFNNNTNLKQHLNPYANGGFSVSYVAINTLFEDASATQLSETFKTFEANRTIISNRLAQANPYWVANGSQLDNQNYAKGYGKNSQDVLIPAFIAAYTKQDATTVSLIKQNNGKITNNPFSGILPRPNWRFNYTGLSKIPALAKIFSSIQLSHQYSGTLSMNSYTSALQFSDPFKIGVPYFIDSTSKNFVPFYLVPNITIQEQFQPLIGIDITTTSQLNIKFEYKKSRILSLSLIDYQLTETNSTEWTFGGSFRKKGLQLPKWFPFLKGKKLENDIRFKLDVSMRDEIMKNSKIDLATPIPTGGQKVLTIQPSIDYVINNRLNIKFFFDQRIVTPYISNSSPTTNTRAGVQVRISLQ
jgi:cell surface protein SprA